MIRLLRRAVRLGLLFGIGAGVFKVVRGRHVAGGVRALVVPGSMQVKRAAEAEGLHEVFTAAGFEWREAGCSMCLGMNPDTLSPGVAAATAVAGRFTAPADL